jgi:hypothetical protein
MPWRTWNTSWKAASPSARNIFTLRTAARSGAAHAGRARRRPPAAPGSELFRIVACPGSAGTVRVADHLGSVVVGDGACLGEAGGFGDAP